jgi:hypothetical protein
MDQMKEYVQKDVDGSETYKFYFDLKNNEAEARTVYIVDEASMVSDVYSEGEFFRFGSGYLLKDFLKYVNLDNNDHAKKIIFVGDPAQLPPVGSNVSPALSPDYLNKHCGVSAECFEMTDVVRHRADSGILANATTIRDALRTCRLNALNVRAKNPDVVPVECTDVVARYAAFGNGVPPENAMVVAYSNRLVNDYNKDIRARFFPGVAGPVAGDRLLVVANNHKGDVSLMNGDLVRLVKVAPEVTSRTHTLRKKVKDKVIESPVTLLFREVELELEGDSGHRFSFSTTIIENLLDSGERDLSSNEQKALYIDFKVRNQGLKPHTALFKDALRVDQYFNALRVKYGYAITCHKAQGGEWPNVFVDFATHGGVFNTAYFRWAYTAITRAKDVLFTINAPHFEAGMLVGGAGPDVSCFKVRDDLFMLGPEVLEQGFEGTNLSNGDESLNGGLRSVATTAMQRRLYLAVSSLLENKAVAIETVESHRYCEHYHLRRGDERAVFLFYYNTGEVVTRILPAAGGVESLVNELAGVFEALKMKYIVLDGDEPDMQAEPVPVMAALASEHVYMVDAYARLTECACKDGVVIDEVRVVSQYHLYCAFAKSGHKVAMDYHFDGKGRMTRVIPRKALTTSAELMQQVAGYSVVQGSALQ